MMGNIREINDRAHSDSYGTTQTGYVRDHPGRCRGGGRYVEGCWGFLCLKIKKFLGFLFFGVWCLGFLVVGFLFVGFVVSWFFVSWLFVSWFLGIFVYWCLGFLV